MEENFLEECWFVYGIRIKRYLIGINLYHSKGSEGSVSFNWRSVFIPLLLGWYHTHPGKGLLSPSSTDNKTMHSWVRGFGRDFICGIICSDEQRCYYYQKVGFSDKKETVIDRKLIKGIFEGPFFFGKI